MKTKILKKMISPIKTTWKKLSKRPRMLMLLSFDLIQSIILNFVYDKTKKVLVKF